MKVFLSRESKDFIKKKLNKKEKEKVLRILKGLSNFPDICKELDCKKLINREGLYRIRKGKIRIIFEVDWRKKIIIVALIDFRGRVYKNL
jgi:mRNA interferase RelE/StbE